MLLIMKGLAWRREMSAFTSGGREADVPSASRSRRHQGGERQVSDVDEAGGHEDVGEEEVDVEEDVIGRRKIRTARAPFRARALRISAV